MNSSIVDLEVEPAEESQAVATFILDKLKAPVKSDLSRKCKSIVSNQTDPKSVSPAQCVKDFPGGCLGDRASVNNVAMRTVAMMYRYPHVMDISVCLIL